MKLECLSVAANKCILCVILPWLMISCSAKGIVEEEKDSKALVFQLRGGEDLNEYQGAPHALKVVLYFLSEKAPAQGMLKTDTGVIQALEGSLNDESILMRQSTFLQPGTTKTLTARCSNRVRHVLLLAGYYQLQPAKVIRMIDIVKDEAFRPFWQKNRKQLPPNLYLVDLGSVAVERTVIALQR